MSTKVVSGCIDCPFVSDLDGHIFNDPIEWWCHGEYDDNGHPLPIGEKAPMEPPAFCPLRKGTITVRYVPPLQIPTRAANHAYLSAGDNPHASGDIAYIGCSLCGRPRRDHPS